MALPQWTEATGYKLADIDERRNIELPLPLSSTDGITITVISGSLPPGLRIENYIIRGVPFEVSRTTEFKFTLRATNDEGINDRTFIISVAGEDAPTWLTPEGILNIGAEPTGQYWIDTRNTVWGMFTSNGVSTFNAADVTVYETVPLSTAGLDGDFAFVYSENQFYTKYASRWRRMTKKQLQSAIGVGVEISSSASVPLPNIVDFWFCTNNNITNGLDLKLRQYDSSISQWVPKTYFVGTTPPPTPGNGTIWIETYTDKLAYVVKVWNASENFWEVINVNYGEIPPERETTAYFVLDSTVVNFQLQAIDTDLAAGDNLRFYIAQDDGELPPGLTLSEDGTISGIVEPLLALDKNQLPGYASSPFDSGPLDFAVQDDDGFDSYYYDTTFYGFSTPTRRPKKLNRFYNFIVTVADNVGETKREFSIYLVGDDFLRADNTIMKSGTGLFTADVTYLRNPVWLTPGDLGVRRANNYVTLYLDVLDPNSLLGTISYRVLPYNDDGTASELPPGIELDGLTGEIAGIVPYQPAVSKDYRFTLEALRQEADVDVVLDSIATVIEESLTGRSTIKIAKITDPIPGVGTLLDLSAKTLEINGYRYTVQSTDSSNTEYDTITLGSPLEPLTSFEPLTIFETQSAGADWVYIENIPDRDIDFYRNKKLNFSSSESYEIQSNYDEDLHRRPMPFVRHIIFVGDSVGFIEFDYDSAGITPIPGEEVYDAYKRYWIKEFELEGTRFSPNDEYRLVRFTGNFLEIDIKSTATTRNIEGKVLKPFHISDSTLIKQEIFDVQSRYFTKLYFDTNLTRTLSANTQLSFGAATNNKIYLMSADLEANTASAVKTFSVRILGEVESTINWITPSVLPTQVANRISYLKLQAETTLVGANLTYDLVAGKLPNGLELKRDGEIVGKINQYANSTGLGLTTVDERATTFDGGTTTIDRKYSFTVIARDRFGYSAVMQTFTLPVTDVDDKVYTNVYMQPFLKTYQKTNFLNFVNDYTIFTPSYIYRPFDNNFGVQKSLRTLAYAGIETQTIDYFVASVAKNHKKKRFNFGELKTAVAKQPGSSDIVYEVVYVEIVDPQEPASGSTALSYKIKTTNPQTVDELKYEIKDDVTSVESGGDAFTVTPRVGDTIRVSTTSGTIPIDTRAGIIFVPAAGQIEILSQSGTIIVVRSVTFTVNTSSDPLRYRPNGNVITTDSDAIKTSQSTDNLKYISNISNMRKRIAEIGVNERQFLPLWMRTSQDGTIEEIDYVTAMPICYCKPGTSTLIKENIENANFDFKNIDYEIDRYIIDSTTNNQTEQFVLFANYKFNV
jgi:hypothetical protein